MASPLRVALISAFPPGQKSLNEYGLHIAIGLAARSEVGEVIVIADKIDTPFDELDLGPKIKVHRTWQFNRLSSAFNILAALKREKIDVALWNVQTATFGDREATAALGLLGPLVSRIFGIPSGVIAHNIIGGIDLENTQLKGQRLRQTVVQLGGSVVTRAMLSANYVTVTLRGYHELLTASFPKANVHLVSHGIFDCALKDVVPIAERPKRIVTMGKFGTYKRLETLLDAFDLLRKEPEFADFELVIGGSDHPSVPGYLTSVAKSREADPQVKFHGYVPEDNVADFFGTAKLSVFDYSATTGSSGVLHQTASYGAVPVFPRIGDFVDLCRDEGLSGAHYAVLDATDMARAMAAVLRDPELGQRISESNLMAAAEMPFSDVVSFHINQFNRIIGMAETTKTHSAGTKSKPILSDRSTAKLEISNTHANDS